MATTKKATASKTVQSTKKAAPGKKGSVRKKDRANNSTQPINEIRGKTIGATPDSVVIRMYCHGFGDCFLLIFHESKQPVYYMLIDCGMLTGDTSLLRKTITDINKSCGGRLDLVVQTHQHKDHISGFNQKDTEGKLLWDSIEVDRVWLAWTENTSENGDELAKILKEKQNKKKEALARSLGLYRSYINNLANKREVTKTFHGENYLAAQERYASALGQILEFMDINLKDVDNIALESDFKLGFTMEDAMAYFIKRATGENGPDVSFWNPGDLADKKQIGMKSINVYFLGPPKDYQRLKQMDDDEHIEMYLNDMGLSDNYYLALTDNEKNGSSKSPFNVKYFWSASDCTKEELQDNDHVWTLYHNKKNKTKEDPDNSWRKIEVDWLHNAGALALHLDSYTNNTSLVMAIEFEATGKVMLFPGDAQIGNWLSWTEPVKEGSDQPRLTWKVKRNGKTEIVTAVSLLEQTVFYKVGHHASHNATAKKHGLELMTSKELVAMIPVDEEVAKKQGKRGWKMPASDLYERLKQKTKGRIVRLDKGNILFGTEEKLPDVARPTKEERESFSNKVKESGEKISINGKQRPLYIEYLLEL